MRRCGTFHALAQPSQSPSRLSAITSQAIRIALSAGKMGASRKRNDSVTKRLPCPALVAFGRDSSTRRVVGRHPVTSCVVGRLLDAQTPPSVRILPENARDVRKPPENPAASGCRPNLQRRPDVARQMQRNYHSAIDTQESATMSTSRDARPPHVRACFHVPNNFLTPEYPLRRYTIVT